MLLRRLVLEGLFHQNGGIDHSENEPFFGKFRNRKIIKESGLEYTFVIVGAFLECMFGTRFSFEIEAGKAHIYGDGNQRISTIDVSDIAKCVPEILLDPSTKNQSVYLASESLSYHEAIPIFEEELGKKFEITYESVDYLKQIVADESKPYFNRLISQVKIAYLDNQDYEKKKKVYPNIKLLTVREYARKFKK